MEGGKCHTIEQTGSPSTPLTTKRGRWELGGQLGIFTSAMALMHYHSAHIFYFVLGEIKSDSLKGLKKSKDSSILFSTGLVSYQKRKSFPGPYNKIAYRWPIQYLKNGFTF